ncbi:MAG: hypothetical protein COW24_04835 [Candidatus Kerfeldbacteria bacterium CG15_BIG_FIL_POST_REV_8_21_14_020_45_12]|uniref:Transcription regulator TrmB N-terminal domain-containing protein n=1 Tax=Candidatus Kerfeldbacteria bacterium CG15_BIG_FIL_POST_REV_8_21_14_020_45_12 TaxID=2014247 RepID=A0A2M7H2P0_9BACT|nr:MAG: hypothetical protein COW24_04835 [Candidatus Kerfeldbacteria bacterium CG15_BIG_FIL_POST_REV_8_21_14_020_45_12]PJA93259.1 MAG: hypothetical protein CO132_04085 [Candidatus Kerfeldbacteria bacterium CG_4_9_14_3_um_filter_45_8]
MQELTKQLTELGLSDKQATVYIATLELGSASALDISKQANIKRPTAYVILEELQNMGLVTMLKTGSTTIFLAQKPSVLGNTLEKQLALFQSIKPLLSDIYLKEGARPTVNYYNGAREVAELYRMFLVEHSKIDLLSSDREPFVIRSNDLFNKFYSEISNGGYTVREVVTSTKFNTEYAKIYSNNFHTIRTIDDQFQFFGDNVMFGNTLVVASFDSTPYAIAIESKDLVRTFRGLFELAWRTAVTAS